MQQPALPSDQIRGQQGVYLFSALGGGVLHGAAAADHQLQMLQGPQILQRVFARHDEVCALAGRDRAGHLANACQLRVAQGGGVEVWRAKLYVALRGLQQLSLYFKNRTCKGVVRDGFGIAAVEVEIFVAA